MEIPLVFIFHSGGSADNGSSNHSRTGLAPSIRPPSTLRRQVDPLLHSPQILDGCDRGFSGWGLPHIHDSLQLAPWRLQGVRCRYCLRRLHRPVLRRLLLGSDNLVSGIPEAKGLGINTPLQQSETQQQSSKACCLTNSVSLYKKKLNYVNLFIFIIFIIFIIVYI